MDYWNRCIFGILFFGNLEEKEGHLEKTEFAIVFKQVAHYTSNHGGKENEETSISHYGSRYGQSVWWLENRLIRWTNRAILSWIFPCMMRKEPDSRKSCLLLNMRMKKISKKSIGNRMAQQMEVAYVFQELTNLPEGLQVPEGRVKPFGTGHAILSCIDEVDGPFAVINADDYYGPHALKMIYDYLTTH